ncbi:MarR family winged helix-turn-helix transcriptional regulator [Dongia sp.]|jgi:DNA-binding MarR family transcriptional regulator|uniref:MarR family winged helix-turn-helix transcriptional regulator n=1 Tax=Dongia sp. TaxID=1977262 RepID=UPI0035B14CB6
MRKPQSANLAANLAADLAASPTRIPKAGEGKRGEAGYLGYLLRQAGVAHRNRFEQDLAEIGITNPQFVVLTMLASYPGLSNADLARLSLLTPQTVSVIVGNLIRAGLVERRKHAVHGRIQHIDVTDAGRETLAQCRKPVQRDEQWLKQGLSATEEQVVRRWLANLARDAAL